MANFFLFAISAIISAGAWFISRGRFGRFGIYLGRQCHLYSRADGGQHGYGGYGLQAILPVHGHRLRHRGVLYVLDGHSKL